MAFVNYFMIVNYCVFGGRGVVSLLPCASIFFAFLTGNEGLEKEGGRRKGGGGGVSGGMEGGVVEE